MAIPDRHKDRYIFHFTDIYNLDSIIKNGLLCTNLKNEKNIPHKNIANKSIQERRANMDVPVGSGGKVHDYVPFYFSSINPMLLTLLNQKNVDQNLIIYLCVKIRRLEKADAVYTDASANTKIPPNFYEDPSHLDDLDWELIESKKWGAGTDEDKHRKMAEAFIHKSVDIKEIDAIVVFNDDVKKAVEQIFGTNKVQYPAILFDHNAEMRNYRFYYTKFFVKGQENETLVTGPKTLLRRYRSLIEKLKQRSNVKNNSFRYSSILDLVQVMEDDMSAIKELSEIVGLKQDYSPHCDTVDEHTKKVVAEMKKMDYYKSATADKRYILLCAAYLHDIGKGPKMKWKDEIIERAYPDHPADAVPMLERILSEVEILSDEEIRLICMLVVYHDIVGDCMEENGRNINQIVEVIESKDDLDMLFAISSADTKAIKTEWYERILNNKESFVAKIMKMKKL